MLSFPLDIYPEVGLLEHMVVLFLIFWRSFHIVPQTGVRNYCGFDLQMISDVENHSMYLLAICISSLGKYLFSFSVHILIVLVIYLLTCVFIKLFSYFVIQLYE